MYFKKKHVTNDAEPQFRIIEAGQLGFNEPEKFATFINFFILR